MNANRKDNDVELREVAHKELGNGQMKRSKIKKITLRESRTETDVSILEAMINDDGDLALEGYDLGEAPRKFRGDSDYEYGHS